MIMGKNEVIHKTGNTQRIQTPRQVDRATTSGNKQRKYGEVWTRGSSDNEPELLTVYKSIRIGIAHENKGRFRRVRSPQNVWQVLQCLELL